MGFDHFCQFAFIFWRRKGKVCFWLWTVCFQKKQKLRNTLHSNELFWSFSSFLFQSFKNTKTVIKQSKNNLLLLLLYFSRTFQASNLRNKVKKERKKARISKVHCCLMEFLVVCYEKVEFDVWTWSVKRLFEPVDEETLVTFCYLFFATVFVVLTTNYKFLSLTPSLTFFSCSNRFHGQVRLENLFKKKKKTSSTETVSVLTHFVQVEHKMTRTIFSISFLSFFLFFSFFFLLVLQTS